MCTPLASFTRSIFRQASHPQRLFTRSLVASQKQPSTSPHSSSRMSSTAATGKPLYEWLVHIPDHPGALEKRLAVRPKHLENMKPNIDAGLVPFGGAVLSKQPAEGEAPDMIGSFMLFKAESEEKVREAIENDVYTLGGAWDAKNAKIYPFRCAVRTAL